MNELSEIVVQYLSPFSPAIMINNEKLIAMLYTGSAIYLINKRYDFEDKSIFVSIIPTKGLLVLLTILLRKKLRDFFIKNFKRLYGEIQTDFTVQLHSFAQTYLSTDITQEDFSQTDGSLAVQFRDFSLIQLYQPFQYRLHNYHRAHHYKSTLSHKILTKFWYLV
jgi:hypothetical protein